MASSGMRLGAWDYLRWGHIEPVRFDGKIVAAKMLVYAGDDEQYISFITPEAYFESDILTGYLTNDNIQVRNEVLMLYTF